MTDKADGGTPRPLNNDSKGPWDFPGSGGGDSEPPKKGGRKPQSVDPAPEGADEPARPVNPWEPQKTTAQKPRGPSLEDLFRRPGGGKGGGGFGGLPKRADGKSWWPLILGGLVLIWVGWTSVHRIDSNEQGVITTFGKYSRTSGPGIALTLPAPIEQITIVDTQGIRRTTIGKATASNDNLVLTRDGSLIDMSYEVGWSIRDPQQYLFQLDQPDKTVNEVAESSMRASVANFDLTQAFGGSRGEIEAQVRQRMQAILDEYRSGIRIQRVTILQSDPPAEVNEAFREVNAAQQQYESYLNDARAYASQATERARGEAQQFDKIYEQYKLAPEVTKTRLYYETMEQVLGPVDKTVVEAGGVTPYLPLPEVKRRADKVDEGVVVTGKE